MVNGELPMVNALMACLPQHVGKGKTNFNLLRPEEPPLETIFIHHLPFIIHHLPFFRL
jgi:hypothetical protein